MMSDQYYLEPATTANFLCGKKCKNKRERERIENEARKKQLEQEAEMRALELQRQQEQLANQQALNELQKQMQDLMLVREQAVVQELSPKIHATNTMEEAMAEEETSSSKRIWLILGFGVLAIGLTAYMLFK